MVSGSCLCGAVRFQIDAALEDAVACHCTQCRKQTGHYLVSAEVPQSAVTLQGAGDLAWYHASDKARRGFCRVCGSTLFWEPLARDQTYVALGAIDPPSGALLARHIFVADKGDYYDLTDGLPQNAQ